MKCQIAYYDMFGNISVSKEVYVADGWSKEKIKEWYEEHVSYCKEVISIMFDK
jgi:hypothetical protein